MKSTGGKPFALPLGGSERSSSSGIAGEDNRNARRDEALTDNTKGERRTLLERCAVVVTMDDARRELAGGWIAVRGRAIEAFVPADEPPPREEGDARIDMAGRAVLPGLVNT